MGRLGDMVAAFAAHDAVSERLPPSSVFSAEVVYIDLYSVLRDVVSVERSATPAICQGFFHAKMSRFLEGIAKISTYPVKKIAFVQGAGNLLEEALFTLEVYRQVINLARQHPERYIIYTSPEGALEGARALASANTDGKRYVVCSSDPRAPFLACDCVRNLAEWCEGRECLLEVVASSRLSVALGLEDRSSLPLFAVLAKRAPSAVSVENLRAIAQCVNGWDGLLCQELLESVFETPGGCVHHDLVTVSVALGEFRGSLATAPVKVDAMNTASLFPFLSLWGCCGVIRMGDADAHECFRSVRERILSSVMPGRLLREVYDDAGGGKKRNDKGLNDSENVIHIAENGEDLSRHPCQPWEDALDCLLKAKTAEGFEVDMTPKVLDIVERLPHELQHCGVSLLLLRRSGIFSESICKHFCKVLTSMPDEVKPEEDMNHACREFQACLTYVALVKEMFRRPMEPLCLPVVPLVDLSIMLGAIDDSHDAPSKCTAGEAITGDGKENDVFEALMHLLELCNPRGYDC
ncbi:hypothetical protein DQ04_06891020 [Trypanosoma grayi]|uniref:hypothetical protein n=1 Tax=Trypanosoma grayi TaxID=71804 RepID=UPI0004F45B44|nr:hypothetical protein DQ04_06891020 [Trypanosoma grayi]KEG08572.1 hypothetical protein DQ04_06891020 [Trypanosoma grayi]